MTSRGILWSLGLCAFVLATNRYASPSLNEALAPGDEYYYLAIAQAAPGLPDRQLLFHHSQRVVLPYALGVIHLALPVSLHRLFQASAASIALATLLVVAATLERLRLHPRQVVIVLSVLALNPWAFRPYLTFPEMVTDAAFVLGLAVVLHGLTAGRAATVVLGQIVASLSRQTGLLVVPLIALWVWQDREVWGRTSLRRRAALSGAAALLAVAVYAGTARLAAAFSYPNENARHIFGLMTWLAGQFDAAQLAAFLLRGLMLPLIPLAVLVALGGWARGKDRTSGPVVALIAGSLFIWAQPLLGGPEVTGGNVQRLMALGLLPFCLALAIRLRDTGVYAAGASRRRLLAIGALLALGSLHHWYVLAATPTAWHKAAFGVSYALACVGCFVLTALEARDTRDAAA